MIMNNHFSVTPKKEKKIVTSLANLRIVISVVGLKLNIL